MAKLLEAGLGGAVAVGATSGFTAGFGLFLTIAVAVAASLLFLGLLLLKIVVSISTILLFVGMPFAAVLWPVAPWIGRLVGRAFAVCLAVPVLWALCFAAAAALTADTLTLNQLTFSANGVLNTLLSPLVAIVLLYVMVQTPAAPLADRDARRDGGRRRVRRAGRSVTRPARRCATRPSSICRSRSADGPTGNTQSESPLGRKIRTATAAAGMAATGGTAAGAAAVRDIERGRSGRGEDELDGVDASWRVLRPGHAKSDGASDPWAYTPTSARPGTGLRGSAANSAPEGAVQRRRATSSEMEQAASDGKRQSRNGRRGESGARGAAERTPSRGPRESDSEHGQARVRRSPTRPPGRMVAGGARRVADTRRRHARGAGQALEEAQEDGWVTNGATGASSTPSPTAGIGDAAGRLATPTGRSKATAPTPGR